MRSGTQRLTTADRHCRAWSPAFTPFNISGGRTKSLMRRSRRHHSQKPWTLRANETCGGDSLKRQQSNNLKPYRGFLAKGWLCFPIRVEKWWEQSYAHGGFTEGMTQAWEWSDAAELGDRWFFTFMGGRGNEIGRTTMEPVEAFVRKNADKPFFVWYGPALPHTPLNAPDRFYKYYEDRDDLSESAKLYYANIAWFDWGVGQLLDTLREERVLGNTLIIYVNDNGWEQAGDVEYADNPITFANGGPRGKGSFFETAFRTPIIFYWQGEIGAARDMSTMASAIDIMPTILDYVGVTGPADLPGYSLRPAIEGDALPGAREHFIGRMTQHRAGSDFRGNPSDHTDDHMGAALDGYYRRDLDWHFVWLRESDETALYDLRTDPGQLTDVSAQHRSKVAQFKADIDAWRMTYEQPAP